MPSSDGAPPFLPDMEGCPKAQFKEDTQTFDVGEQAEDCGDEPVSPSIETLLIKPYPVSVTDVSTGKTVDWPIDVQGATEEVFPLDTGSDSDVSSIIETLPCNRQQIPVDSSVQLPSIENNETECSATAQECLMTLDLNLQQLKCGKHVIGYDEL